MEDDEDRRLASLREQNAELRSRLESIERYTARALMRATRLSQVVAVLGQNLDLETMIDRAAVGLAELFSSDVTLLIVDTGDGMQVEGHWGIEAGEIPSDREAIAELELGAPTEAVSTGPATGTRLPDWLADYGPRHLAWVRLSVGDKALGVMLLMRRADHPFEADEETELRAIGHRIALAIENGLLHRHMTSQLAQLHRLQRLTAELAGTIELDEIGLRLAETLVAEAGVTQAIVFLDRDGEVAAIARAGDKEPGEIIEIGAHAQRWRRFPLSVTDQAVGFVAVADPPEPGSEAHEMLLHLVGLGALALDKALVYDRSIEQARHDSLTGLLGHRVFHEVLDASLLEAAPFSIVLFDIDDFKQINDLHGHQRGDEVLRLVADALRSGLRSGDAIFRVGGEEFYAVLQGASGEDAELVADRLRLAVSEAGSGLPHPVTLSAGVAWFPEHARVRDELLAAADAALYKSKRSGKDRTTVAGGAGTVPATPIGRVSGLELLLERDAGTVAHSLHTSVLAVRLARALELDDERIAELQTAAKLHDIGKIGVPEAILSKPGPLDDEEFRIVRTHPVVGAQLLTAWGLDHAATFVLQHHERIDGRGYPAGLAGDEIALESRIIHVADAYFAMTLDRPYRRALSEKQALDELERHRGTQFDQRVVDAMLSLARARRALDPQADERSVA